MPEEPKNIWCAKCQRRIDPASAEQVDGHNRLCSATLQHFPAAKPSPPQPEKKTAEQEAIETIIKECEKNVRGYIADAPKIMSELTRLFVACTSLTDRAKIRMRMKAILDFISVDTDYPPVPALDGVRRPEIPALYEPQLPQPYRGAEYGRPMVGQRNPGALVQQVRAAVEREVGVAGAGGVEPVPGAARAGENDIVLG